MGQKGERFPRARRPSRRSPGCYLVASVLMLWCGSALATGIYRWTDAQGQVHFGDQPRGRNAQRVHIRPAPPPDPQTERRRAQARKWLRAQEEDTAEQNRRAHKAAAKAARRKQDCRRARERLKAAGRARYLYTQKSGGARHILSSAERTAAMRRMRADVSEYCD